MTSVNLSQHEFAEVVKNTPLVAIDLIVKNKQGQILLGFRNNNPAKDYWFVPGGAIRKDERIEDAFRRVSHNELGIEREIHDAEFKGVYEHFYDTNFAGVPGFGTHYVVLAYVIALNEHPIKPPEDQHSEYQWLSVDELLKAEDVHPLAKEYF
jgi:colanic acid biosynthesis protein WcaH